jgi:hypothetical protein
MDVNQCVDGVPNHLVARSSVYTKEMSRRRDRHRLYRRATRAYHVGEPYSISVPLMIKADVVYTFQPQEEGMSPITSPNV